MRKTMLAVTAFVILLCSCSKKDQAPIENADFHSRITATTTSSALAATGKRFLFDAKHAETAGNADWVIDEDNSTPQKLPTPLQSNITSTTAESYWTGALSSWGIALVKAGGYVETLPSTGTLTYGSTTNTQDLSKYDVFIVDEPNTRFTTSEKTAILNFVKNGGGLFMIADHTASDRNNDGWDSPDIWNDLMSSNSVQTNPFGFKFDLANISETSTNVTASVNTVTGGGAGSVTGLKFNNGTTMTLTAGGPATGLIWQSTATKGSNVKLMAAQSVYGTGRVFMIGDSSPADDGTGAPNNTLFPGWTDLSGNHSRLHLNASYWLAKLQ